MKKYIKYFIGFLLIFIGLILGLNAFGITNINIFFEGWWTLFIIVPSLIGLIEDNDKTPSLIFLILGIWLFLASRDLIEYGLLIKLLLPALLISVGLLILFKDVLNINNKEIKKLENNSNDNDYYAVFGTQKVNFDKENVQNINAKSIFGEIKLDLTNATIQKDIVISTLSIFGGINIYVPENVKIKIKSIPFFGNVEDKTKNVTSEKEITIYIDAICIFGGVEIK
ncbi:MAG: LiaF-related protein [bacterium]|nr:LiaF-related protein [bacterium]